MKLPGIAFGGNYRTSVQTAFRGLNHNAGAGDGELYDMKNLSACRFPCLSPRPQRGLVRTLDAPGGLGAQDVPFWTEGTAFYVNGTVKGAVSAGEKRFAAMGTRILIFPDKLCYNAADDSFGSLEAEWTGTSLTFQNGQLYGEDALANTLYALHADWGTEFSPGDAVTIRGCTRHPENARTLVVREISGDYLYFYEQSFVTDTNLVWTAPEEGLAAGAYCFTDSGSGYSFTLASPLSEGDRLLWDGASLHSEIGGVSGTVAVTPGTSGTALEFRETAVPCTETGELSVSREVPALEHLCVNENRLWGSVGSRIYASKLGDPTNFQVFDGLSTDSWQSDTVDAGDFTACVSYLGYPVFFKENCVYKIYGDRPSNFQWTPSVRLGVQKGCEKSLAVAGETLYYLSRAGIMAYTGGIPAGVGAPLGQETHWQDAVGGSDGVRYYVSLHDGTAWSLCVYDTRYGVWHREDASHARDFACWDGSLHMLLDSGALWRLDGETGTRENPVEWEAEFADFTDGSPNRKGILRLQLRAELEAGSMLAVLLRYDGEAAWRTVKTLTAGQKRSFVLPMTVRRCDHWRLKLSGVGAGRVDSLAITRYGGSEKE